MVNYCAAFGCKEKYVKGGPVTFHSFPKNENRRKLWEIKLRRANFKATDHTVICSKHFTPESFDTNKLGGTWLREDAVPTLFNFPDNSSLGQTSLQLPVKRKLETEENTAAEDDVKNDVALSMKKFRYMGDFSENDMDSPTKARKFLRIAFDVKEKKNLQLNALRKQNRELKKRIASWTQEGKQESDSDAELDAVCDVLQHIERVTNKSLFYSPPEVPSTEMSSTFDLENHPKIRWKVELSDDFLEISEVFRVRNTDCRLTCYNDDDDTDTIFLGFEFGKGIAYESTLWSKPVVVTAQVESCRTGEILPSLTTSTKNPDFDTPFWILSFSEMKQADPDFDGRHLTFVVTFHGDPSEAGTDEKSVQTSLCINAIQCSESLSEDLSKLLDSDPDPDVDFQCEGQSMKVHGSILRARSPVLAKMIQSQMVEGGTRVVKIEDMDMETLKLFVRYLYTAKLDEEPTFKVAMALYEAAGKYEVRSLAKRCSQSLTKKLEVGNACDILVVADAQGDQELVEKATVFILERNMPASDDGPWLAFRDNHSKLANTVYHRFCKRVRL